MPQLAAADKDLLMICFQALDDYRKHSNPYGLDLKQFGASRQQASQFFVAWIKTYPGSENIPERATLSDRANAAIKRQEVSK